jgi:hypothetical protein
MKNITSYQDQQAVRQLHSKVDQFFDNFSLGTLLNRAGIRKLRGTSPVSLLKAIFMLAFSQENFFRGIVEREHEFGKDAAYALLQGVNYNWRKLLMLLAARITTVFYLLTEDRKRKVLIIDDSTYERPHSRKVELLTRVRDNCRKRFTKGFKMLTLAWSDGSSTLPVDFALLSSRDPNKRLCGEVRQLDRRCCAVVRRKEAVTKSTELLEGMVNRVIKNGIDFGYILMDSWFAFPSIIRRLHRHRPVICMLKDMPNIRFQHHGVSRRVTEIYRNLTKRPGRAKILAGTIVELADGLRARIIFVRHRSTRKWLALLSTDLEISNEKIVQIYGKRWDIEVMFKVVKHYLNLEREVQMRNFDGLIAHATVVMIRYCFLSFQQRMESDERALGSLFYACADEMQDITLIEALKRIMTLAQEKIRQIGEFAEDAVRRIVDVVMSTACHVLLSPSRKGGNKDILTTC